MKWSDPAHYLEVKCAPTWQESPIIGSDPESGATFLLRRETVRKWSMKPEFSPCHLSQDYALNHLTRLESLPNSGCSRKSGYCAAVFVSQERESGCRGCQAEVVTFER